MRETRLFGSEGGAKLPVSLPLSDANPWKLTCSLLRPPSIPTTASQRYGKAQQNG